MLSHMAIIRLILNTYLTYGEKCADYRKNEDVFIRFFDIVIASPA